MSDLIDKRIAELEKELAGLRRQKLAELQTQVAALQASLAGGDVVAAAPAAPAARRGRPAKAEGKGWATAVQTDPGAFASIPRKKRGRKRGKHVSDEEVLAQLTKVVTAAGKDGISARQAAQQADVFYPRAIAVMDANFKKSGVGKWTRYTLK